MYVPCAEEHFDWVKKTLALRAPSFVVVKPGYEIGANDQEDTDKSAAKVNWEVFK